MNGKENISYIRTSKFFFLSSCCSILLLIYFCTAKLFCQESFLPCVLLLPVWSFWGQLWLFMHDCSDPVTARNISFIYLLLFYRSLSFSLFFHSIHFSSTFSTFPLFPCLPLFPFSFIFLSFCISISLYFSLFLFILLAVSLYHSHE